MMMSSIQGGDRMPIKNPLIPMIAVTGRPDKKRMEQVLRSYKNAGIDQFLIYPRSGLEIEYMSDEWLALCKNTVQIAHELDMHTWLYDEYNWPSGNCRGQVTENHPEFYPNALVFEKTHQGIASRVIRNFIGADILNPDAVARFIQLTHQRYYDAMPEYFGTTILGIFTDEPSFSYFTTNQDGTFSANKSDTLALAWYDGLEEEYRALRGRELRQDAVMHLQGHTPEHFWDDYYMLTGRRMREVFIGGMRAWCDAHGILLTGHLMCEDAPSSARYNGDALKNLCAFSLPGMDDIATAVSLLPDDGCDPYEKWQSGMELSAMALCHYAGQHAPGQLAELFSLGPADMPLSVLRQMLWMVACHGVDHYVVAVAALDPKGNIEKNSWYFPTSQTAPWFPYYRELGKEARIAAQTARKPYAPQVRLRYPAAFFRRHCEDRACDHLGELFRKLLTALISHQVQYLYVAEDEDTDLPVMAIDEQGLFLEGESSRFQDADAFCKHVNARIPRRLVVTDAQGAQVRDVMCRLWQDGTVTLVDLTRKDESDRLLSIVLDGKTGHVRLPGRGVFCGTLKDMNASMPSCLAPAILGPITCTLPGNNQLRCLYLQKDPQYALTLTQDLSQLRLLLRTDVQSVQAALDDQIIVAEQPVSDLPDGFAPLYRETLPFSLSKGKHTLRILNGAADHRYFPAVFLKGPFRVEANGQISPESPLTTLGPATGIPHYTGSYVLACDIQVPAHDNLVLALDVNFACTHLYLDGESLGVRCFTPFEWEVPAHFAGRNCKMEVHITTSIMPMFGPWQQLEEEQPHADWIGNRPGRYTQTGLMKPPMWKTCP